MAMLERCPCCGRFIYVRDGFFQLHYFDPCFPGSEYCRWSGHDLKEEYYNVSQEDAP